MMQGPAFPAAHALAPQLHTHFSRHLEEARRRTHEPLASLPDVDAIGAIIETAFWASLRREEGYVPRISLAFVDPEQATQPLRFEQPLPRPGCSSSSTSAAACPASSRMSR